MTVGGVTTTTNPLPGRFLCYLVCREGPPKGFEGIFSWGGCENVFEAKVGDNGSWETRTVRRASWRHQVDGPTELASL